MRAFIKSQKNHKSNDKYINRKHGQEWEKLHPIYEDKVFQAGKTSKLAIKKGEQIELPNGETITAKGTEGNKELTEIFGSYEKYQKLNGMKKIRWHVDARFNYKDIKFSNGW